MSMRAMRGRGGSSIHGNRRRRRRRMLPGKSECLALASLAFAVAVAGDSSEAQDAAEGDPDASFPPGCSWKCYLDDHPKIAGRIPHTKEAALDHYLSRGKGHGLDCTCKGEGERDGPAPGGGRDNSTIESEKQELINDIAAGKNDAHAAEEKADLEASFPPGCTWECYLANYKFLAKRLPQTEKAALKHYLNHGIKDGRDCTCHDGDNVTNPVLASINGMDETLAKLDFLDDDSASLEAAHLEQLKEERLEASFPPGCSWECYLSNYKALANHLPHTEEAALNHYLTKGLKQGRDCTCMADAAADPSLDPIVEVEQELTQLDFQDDDGATEQAEVLEEQVEDMVADSFPPGCSWECYLANYDALANHLPQTEEAALNHYLTKGLKQGRDCSCKEDAAADPSLDPIVEVEQELTNLDFLDDDHAAEREEILEEREGEMLADSFPPGCSWECYLGNYKALANHLPHTEEAALQHYLTHGVKQGRDCSCRDEDGGDAADPTSEKIKEVEKELIGLDFQDDDTSEERTDELEMLKQELMEIKKSEHDTRFALAGAILFACPVIFFLLWRQRKQNIRLRNYAAVLTSQRTESELADGFEEAGGSVEGTLA